MIIMPLNLDEEGAMTAQEYLEQYRTVSARVDQLDKLISRMSREIFNGPSEQITVQLSASIGRSGNQNYWEAEDLVEFKLLLDRQKEKKRQFRNFMKTVISQVESMDNDDSVILTGRFILFETWKGIADSLGYSYDYTRGYRKDVALNRFDMKFGKIFYEVNTNNAK